MPESMSRVLVLFAHPALHKSHANRRLIRDVQSIEGITFHELYEAYPDLHIDVEKEQKLLDAHDVVVMHFPMFWYSSPAILKEWQDLVLQHGWAYGRHGNALQGKRLKVVVTTGGGNEAYTAEGTNHFTIRELLAPFAATARMCGMRFMDPFIVYASHRLEPSDLDDVAAEYEAMLTELTQLDPIEVEFPSPSLLAEV